MIRIRIFFQIPLQRTGMFAIEHKCRLECVKKKKIRLNSVE